MFIGTHTHKLDQKGRVSVPAPFRSAIGSDFLLSTRGDRACLIGYPSSAAERLVTEDTAPFVEALHVDSDGRILIKQKLREKFLLAADSAQNEAMVVFAGHMSYFSIWRKADWEKEEELLLSRP